MKSASLFSILLILAGGQAFAVNGSDYPIQPVPFTAVEVGPGFWAPRMETNRRVTVPYCFDRCEETGRISNFVAAAERNPDGFQGIYFNDSDVFKIVEGAAYTLALQPDPELDAYLDDLIAKFAAAQEEDGYLYTAKTSQLERQLRARPALDRSGSQPRAVQRGPHVRGGRGPLSGDRQTELPGHRHQERRPDRQGLRARIQGS